MPLFKVKNDPLQEKQLGIQFTTQGIRFALIEEKQNNKILLEVDHHETSQWDQQKQFLKEKIAQLNLSAIKTNILIPQSDYQIFLVEQPMVSINEKKDAVRWRIADYLDYPIEEAVVDYIEVPQKNKENNAMLTYVIATKKSTVDEYAEFIKELGLNVISVDICQSALREIAFQLDDSDEGQALLHIEEHKSHIILFKNKILYMMRDFDIGHRQLKTESELQDLAVEIQRSIDYCSSNLKNIVISRIVLTPLPERKAEILTNLSNILSLPVRMINYAEFIKESEKLDMSQSNSNTFVIGAAISGAL
ncbi:pilus assembly protein PilM [Candidatus Berkiella aquae]|uniref:Competence protein A n=1 Tax=Candidatus Berkiella aquae TaxID=295108 RepID=A0A0Q9YMW8_9GAMM|nr:pilus assembly protein PilM [Candidatus Berkiella aquae]MCS5712674.1 pilus assembly protein PilM [Candidatus Berkiella aquae]